MQDTLAKFAPVAAVVHMASVGMSGGAMVEYETFKVCIQCNKGSYYTFSNDSLFSKYMLQTNVHGTQNVVNACIKAEVKALLYISTYNVVFGGRAINGGDESAKAFPADEHTDKYSQSKAVSEHIILAANGRSMRTCALRPAAIYGEVSCQLGAF